VSDRCPRCGLPRAADAMTRCEVGDAPVGEPMTAELAAEHNAAVVACRDREIANLHAHLRSVTRRLESIGTQVQDVLEALS